MRVLSFSDFHLFASRSRGNAIIDQVKELAQEADTLIICGDLFDFRWSNFSNHSKAFDEAFLWMERLCQEITIPVVYILGNHDGLAEFIPTLKKMEEQLPHFSWREDYLVIGNTLFLHGDIPIKSEGKKLGPRDFVSNEKIKHPLLSILYHLITSTYLLRLWRLSSNQNRKIPYIAKAIQNTPHLAHTISHVVFGHTHNKISEYTYEGITFFNGGTAIKTFPIEVGSFTIKK